MVEYGNIEYWNKRYANLDDSPFDWLVEYKDVADILDQLLPEDKDSLILLPGCGNAPFSPELCFQAGYVNQLNIDLSPVVIKQMAERYGNYNPDDPNPTTSEGKKYKMQWKVMDVLNLEIPSESILTIIDKSLIDTLMCYRDGHQLTKKMIRELHRVLAPNGRYITFSLHSMEEVFPFFDDNIKTLGSCSNKNNEVNDAYDWEVSYHRVKSSRWNPTTERRRAVACTMVVCYKRGQGTACRPVELRGVLSEKEFNDLYQHSKEVNLTESLKLAKTDELMKCLDAALDHYLCTDIKDDDDLLNTDENETNNLTT